MAEHEGSGGGHGGAGGIGFGLRSPVDLAGHRGPQVKGCVGLQLGQGVGAGRHRLGAQGLRRPAGRHLTAHHAGQVMLQPEQVHRLESIPLRQHPHQAPVAAAAQPHQGQGATRGSGHRAPGQQRGAFPPSAATPRGSRPDGAQPELLECQLLGRHQVPVCVGPLQQQEGAPPADPQPFALRQNRQQAPLAIAQLQRTAHGRGLHHPRLQQEHPHQRFPLIEAGQADLIGRPAEGGGARDRDQGRWRCTGAE